MENTRKELRYLSLGMFAFIVYEIVNIATYLLGASRLDTTAMEAAAAAMLPFIHALAVAGSVASIIVFAILGIKGLKESQEPTSAKFHIRLATIAFVVFTLSTIFGAINLFSSTDVFNDLGGVLFSSLFAIDCFGYAKAAKAIRIQE